MKTSRTAKPKNLQTCVTYLITSGRSDIECSYLIASHPSNIS